MHRSVFCSAVERTAVSGVRRAAAGRAGSPAAAALFSTTAAQAKLKDVSGRQGRLAAAASAVGALGNTNDAPSAPSTPSPFSASPPGRAPPGVTDARSLGATASGSDGAAGAGGDGKIINVRSLPRRAAPGFSTGTRFQGAAAGGRTGGRFAPSTRTNTNPAFQTGPPAGAGRTGGNSSGSGGPQRSGRRNRQGAGGRKALAEKKKQQQQQATTHKAQQLDDDELEWLETHAEDVATVYEPAATTAEGLAAGLKGHGPAVPWSRTGGAAAPAPGAVAAGVTEAALRAMRVLAGGWAFSAGSTDVLGTEVARERLRLGQRTFFDSAAERVAVEAVLHGSRRAQRRRAQWAAAPETAGSPVPSLIAPPSAATKAAIVEAAVRGVYAAAPAAAAAPATGKRAAFADPAAVFASFARYQTQDHTYTAEHMRRFEARARGLLAREQAREQAKA